MSTGRELEVNLSTLLGLNNRRPDFRLRTDKGVFLRAADNAIVSDAGTAKRRAGYTEEFAGTDCHSFWVDAATDEGYYVDESTLYRVTASGDGLTRTVLAADLARGRQLTYARVGTDVVFSDGVTNRCIGTDGERAFGVPELQVMPGVAAAAGGALTAGVYQVCFCFANDQLELSGTTPAALADVPASGKLQISNLPTTWPRGATALFVYVSQPNGQTMFVELRLYAPAATAELTALVGSGMQATTYLRRALPSGRILRFFAARLYVAVGPLLYYSEVYNPALNNPARGFVQFPADITVLEPCDDGLFLVADQTYWLAGDIEQTTPRAVLPNTAVFGSAGSIPNAKQCFWMGNKGMVLGGAGGAIELMQDENVVVGASAAGASFVQEQDGQRHAVSSLFGAEGAVAAARSYMDAEIVRKETSL